MAQTPAPRPWRCPQDETCPASTHDHHAGYRAGCRSLAAKEDKRIYEKRRRAGGHHRRVLRLPAIGTKRRLQALHALGYSYGYLARELGWDRRTTRHRAIDPNPYISARNHALVRDLYARLAWEMPPTGRVADRTRAVAASHGFAAPMAWDDIDDPAATPDERVATPSVPGRAVGSGEKVAAMTRERYTTEQIAEHLGITVRTVQRLRSQTATEEVA